MTFLTTELSPIENNTVNNNTCMYLLKVHVPLELHTAINVV